MKLLEALKTSGWQSKILNPKSRIDMRRWCGLASSGAGGTAVSAGLVANAGIHGEWCAARL